MKRLLPLVFLGLLATPAWAQFASPDPAKLRLSSANVLVLDAAADRQIYAKSADEVTPDRIGDEADDGDGRPRRPAVARRDDRRRHGRFRLPEGQPVAAADGFGAVAARNAAAGADVVRKPRGIVAGAPLSRRHARVRRRDELQGRIAGPHAYALFRPDRAVGRKRVDGERPGQARAGCRRISADPRFHDDAVPLRRSAARRARRSASTIRTRS